MTSADSLSGYTHITLEVINSLPDKRLVTVIFDYIRDQVGDDYAQLAQVLAALPAGFSLIYQLYALNGEIASGGFNQYFFNHLDTYAPQQAEALALIGAAEHHQIFQAAHRLHAAEQQNEALQKLYREGTPEAFAATYRLTGLGEWDDAWYALDKEFDAALAQFIRRQPQLFVTAAS